MYAKLLALIHGKGKNYYGKKRLKLLLSSTHFISKILPNPLTRLEKKI